MDRTHKPRRNSGRRLSDRQSARDRKDVAQPVDDIGIQCAGVAHELNNVLSVILGETDLALMFGTVNDQQRESFASIRKAGVQAAGLARQLLAFSKRKVVAPAVFDLNELLLAVSRTWTQLGDDNIALITRTQAIKAAVLANRSQIEQVIHDLIINAREAMATGGMLTLETENVTLSMEDTRSRPFAPPGEYAAFTVSDTGIGMTDDVKAHIFEAYFTTKPTDQGMGLGLATCLGIIEESGGHISVRSEVNAGTAVTVLLPLNKASLSGTAAPAISS